MYDKRVVKKNEISKEKQPTFKWQNEKSKTPTATKKENDIEEGKVGMLFKGMFKNDGMHGDNIKIYHPNGALAFYGNLNEGEK